MSEAEPDYLNIAKNRWRIDKWVAIKKFVQRHRRVKDTLVVYLAGPGDLDRHVATQLGFRTSNLIAVNGSRQICDAIRRRGHPVMHGRFERVVAAIPDDLDIGVIDADLCAGLTNTTAEIFENSWLKLLNRELVLSFNLQRGRDSISNEIRSEFMALEDLEPELLKHRGLQLWSRYHNLLNNILEIKLERLEMPWHLSYRSNRVVMDSVVFPWNFAISQSDAEFLRELTPNIYKAIYGPHKNPTRERQLWIARKAVMSRKSRNLH